MRSNLGMGDSMDDLTPSPTNDPESGASRKDFERAVSPSGGAATSLTDQASTRALRKTSPAPKPRESLDGETIFAVGDDGVEWSEGEAEDDADADETRKLTKKI
jgi:hypothetical protein